MTIKDFIEKMFQFFVNYFIKGAISLPHNELFIFVSGSLVGILSCHILATTNNVYHTTKSANRIQSAMNMKEFFQHEEQNDNVTSIVPENVTVLCYVMTTLANHATKAKYIKKTWGNRCTHLVFMSSKSDESLGAVTLPVPDGSHYRWQRTMEALKYLYYNYYDKADWFLRTDDDTYVIVENLRLLLSQYNSHKPVYHGFIMNKLEPYGYTNNRAGYVLSKEALKMFIEKAIPNTKECKSICRGGEDDALELGQCLASVGINPLDSRDSQQRPRFFPNSLGSHLLYNVQDKFDSLYNDTYYPLNGGMDCCSDTSISFHTLSYNDIRELEYYIYHLKPYGGNSQETPARMIHRVL